MSDASGMSKQPRVDDPQVRAQKLEAEKPLLEAIQADITAFAKNIRVVTKSTFNLFVLLNQFI